MPANALHRAHPRIAARRDDGLCRRREPSERRLRAVSGEEPRRGQDLESIAGDLPARGSTYAIAEDHVDPRLLFAGTEFGAYWSKDGGQHWRKIAGLPTIAVREIAIQKRENDLVLGTFGRGIYIVDDYSAVRATTPETLAYGGVPILRARRAALRADAAVRDEGQGISGRDVLHRAESAVRRGRSRIA